MKRTRLLLIGLVLTVVGVSIAGQEAKYRAPRTENGRPDLQGVWNFSSGVALERPAAVAGRKVVTKEESEKQRAAIRTALLTLAKFAPVEDVGLDLLDNTPHVEDLRTSLISYPENGRLPALLEGVRRAPGPEDFIAALADSKDGQPPASLTSLLAGFGGGKKDSHKDFSVSERCLFRSPVPLVPQLDGNYVQIIQGSNHVALISDFTHRIVTLSVGPLAADTLRSWSGTSTGHWEGETLVVETRNFAERFSSFAGAGNARDKLVTERFTRTANNRIEDAATLVDPKTFKDRIELSFPMTLVDARIYEGACHEGNYSLPNALSGARTAEETAKGQ